MDVLSRSFQQMRANDEFCTADGLWLLKRGKLHCVCDGVNARGTELKENACCSDGIHPWHTSTSICPFVHFTLCFEVFPTSLATSRTCFLRWENTAAAQALKTSFFLTLPTPCCIISATHRSKRCQFGCVIQQISASSWELIRSGPFTVLTS